MKQFSNSSEVRLFKLFSSDEISISEVDHCIRDGARISEIIEDTTILLQIVDCFFEYTSTEIYLPSFLHLVKCGANVNHQQVDGNCVLSELVSMHNDLAVRECLKIGANPNVIEEWRETILDAAQIDLSYHKMEMNGGEEYHRELYMRMERIVQALIQFGAKNVDDLQSDSLGRWLKMFGCSPTGLLTDGGNIEIDNLPLNQMIKKKFRVWKNSYYDSWGGLYGERPKGFDRGAHNSLGRTIIQEIRNEIKTVDLIMYLTICPDGEAKGIRNVHWENILAT